MPLPTSRELREMLTEATPGPYWVYRPTPTRSQSAAATSHHCTKSAIDKKRRKR